MYSKKLFGIRTFSCSVGSIGLRPNDPEELESKEFLVLTNQYNIETFSYYLRLLPSCSSTHHQTNIESAQICSEDHLSVSSIRSPHLLLEVILRAEEECLFFLSLGKLDRIELLGSISIHLSSYSLSMKSVTNVFRP